MANDRPTHLDLFSGLGGFALAAKWAGYRTIAFCENDRRSQEFLGRTWGIKVEPDIKTLNGADYRGISLLTAGPPCQPASRAGNQGGEGDDRWLWGETLRVLEEAGPTECLFENPVGIEDVGLDGILSEMERIGYEVQPFRIPACAVDSPQLRERYWIIGFRGRAGDVGDPKGGRFVQCEPEGESLRGISDPSPEDDDVADGPGHDELADADERRQQRTQGTAAQSDGERENWGIHHGSDRAANQWGRYVWVPCADSKLRRAPDGSFGMVDGVFTGLPTGLARPHRSLLAALGNSIVPQVAYEIIRAIRLSNEAVAKKEP